jgi:two-component system, sensor histidine kinase and response regulator
VTLTISKADRIERLSAELNPGQQRETKGRGEEMNDITYGCDLPSVDMTELLARVDNDRELLHELLVIFKEDFPRHADALQRAVAREDTQQVMTVSHALKGMLANLAIHGAAGSAGQLEHAARNGQPSLFPEGLAAFEKEVKGLLLEVERYLAKAQS